MQRNRKAISLIYLACGAIVWMLFREILATLLVIVRLPLPTDWIVPPTDVAAIGLGLVTFVVLLRSAPVNEFTNEVITELAKVVWPNRKETVLSTGVVSVLVGICAMILFLFDMLWGTVVRVFYQ